MKTEKYFIGSNGDMSERLFFDKESAFAARHDYIDSFDKVGERVKGYKLVDNEYTTEF